MKGWSGEAGQVTGEANEECIVQSAEGRRQNKNCCNGDRKAFFRKFVVGEGGFVAGDDSRLARTAAGCGDVGGIGRPSGTCYFLRVVSPTLKRWAIIGCPSGTDFGAGGWAWERSTGL